MLYQFIFITCTGECTYFEDLTLVQGLQKIIEHSGPITSVHERKLDGRITVQTNGEAVIMLAYPKV